jgi:stage II sporulation protein D
MRACMMLFAAAMYLAGSAASAGLDLEEPIRVGLLYGSSAPISITLFGAGAGQGERSGGDFDGEMRVTADGDSLVLEHQGRRARVGRWVEFWPTGTEPWVELNNATYRGKLRIEPAGRGRLKAVNIVSLEDYVRGVVANEMFADGAACKVQAVISRTFASYTRDVQRKHRRDGFDICTTGHCQVYHGVDSERPVTDEAVHATSGEIITYRGRPIFSAYHANAGGITEPVDEAWPGSVKKNFPYLRSVESPYDAVAAGLRGYDWCYHWRRDIKATEIRDNLRASGTDIGDVRDLVVKKTTSTGRVRELEVIGTGGHTRLRRPSEVRALLNAPSPRLGIRKRGSTFEVIGWGRGHGVGLSQHGALGMSKAGYTYEQILGHFYRGVTLASEYGRGRSRSLTPPELRMGSTETTPVVVPAGVS